MHPRLKTGVSRQVPAFCPPNSARCGQRHTGQRREAAVERRPVVLPRGDQVQLVQLAVRACRAEQHTCHARSSTRVREEHPALQIPPTIFESFHNAQHGQAELQHTRLPAFTGIGNNNNKSSRTPGREVLWTV